MLRKKCSNSLSIWLSFDKPLKKMFKCSILGKNKVQTIFLGNLLGQPSKYHGIVFLALECNINRAYNSYYASVVQPILFVMPYD